MLAQLIDWNTLNLFSGLVPAFKQMLGYREFRAEAFSCLNAIVDKGMSEDEKVQVIMSLDFLQIVKSVHFDSRETNMAGDLEE